MISNPSEYTVTAPWTRGGGCGTETRDDYPEMTCDVNGSNAFKTNRTAGSCNNFPQSNTQLMDDVNFSPIFGPANTGNAPNGQPYAVGLFLVGAYQEILGDLHNLFGDTDAVHVRLDQDGAPLVDHEVQGDQIEEVLHYVQYERGSLLEKVRRISEDALRAGKIDLADSARLRRRFEQGLREYTYLSRDD